MLTHAELEEKFKNDMGWGAYPQKAMGRAIFNFLSDAHDFCKSHHIVLDISAGQCRYKPFFEGTQYVALDSAVGDDNWDFSGIDIFGNAMDLPIKSDSIDCCLNFTSLEHYPDPQSFFREVFRVLKHGGRMYLYVPFLVVGEHQIPHDYYRYTRFALAKFVQDCGLDIVYLKPTNGIFETAQDVLTQAVNLMPASEHKEVMEKFMGSFLGQVFQQLESAHADQLAAEWPNSSPVIQMPGNYCLCCAKPGELSPSEIIPSKTDLVKHIQASPCCKANLDEENNLLKCSSCGETYRHRHEGPDFSPSKR